MDRRNPICGAQYAIDWALGTAAGIGRTGKVAEASANEQQPNYESITEIENSWKVAARRPFLLVAARGDELSLYVRWKHSVHNGENNFRLSIITSAAAAVPMSTVPDSF